MATDPNSPFELSPEQQAKLTELAEQTGKGWPDLLDEMLGRYASTYAPAKHKARFGGGKGLLTIADDFDDALPDFQDYMQ
jgi:hypothetical protein